MRTVRIEQTRTAQGQRDFLGLGYRHKHRLGHTETTRICSVWSLAVPRSP